MLTTWTPYARIGRPLEAHNARTPEDYLAIQARLVADLQRARPAIAPRDPFVSPTPPVMAPFINGGRWGVLCGCMGLVSYDPDWQLACCGGCGAIYEALEPPDGWEEAEQLLLQRDQMNQRHWLPQGGFGHAPESVEDLARENRAHGLR
jgi:hypothetical protein